MNLKRQREQETFYTSYKLSAEGNIYALFFFGGVEEIYCH